MTSKITNESKRKGIERLGKLIQEFDRNLSFKILEVGARPIGDVVEPFYLILDLFPESKILAFEVDEALCEQLNHEAKPGLKYHPVALGRTEETRPFYQTKHPMCSSLYKPNESVNDTYNNMQVAKLDTVHPIETVSLDHFMAVNNIESADFIKIDIQGAELDVFQGGTHTLNEIVFIVSEVEFIPLYIGQPLFGDVSAFLAQNEFMFHKFLGTGGRTLKPVTVANNPNLAIQQMWADAVFIKDIFKVSELTPEKLLKMGLLAYVYSSPDLTFYCFKNYDQQQGSNLSERFMNLGNS